MYADALTPVIGLLPASRSVPMDLVWPVSKSYRAMVPEFLSIPNTAISIMAGSMVCAEAEDARINPAVIIKRNGFVLCIAMPFDAPPNVSCPKGPR